MSMRQYAKHRGVSTEAVSKAVKRGRITCARDDKGHALIDPELADREWDANSDPMKYRGPEAKSEPQQASEVRGPSVQQSIAVLKAYQARLAKLEYEARAGKLLNADDVKQKWITICSLIRTKVLGVPSKFRQRTTGITAEQFTALEEIIREALEEIADGEP